MTSRLTRSFASDLEVRGGDGRTITGLAAPFGTWTDIRDFRGSYRERFVRGAFERTIRERGPERVKFLALHDDRSLPLGRAVVLREDTAGLYAEFRVSKTSHGDDVLELVRDGALTGLSVGFGLVRDEWNGRNTERSIHEARLHEVSVVNFPAYEDALVSGVRSEADPPPSYDVERMQLDILRRKQF